MPPIWVVWDWGFRFAARSLSARRATGQRAELSRGSSSCKTSRPRDRDDVSGEAARDLARVTTLGPPRTRTPVLTVFLGWPELCTTDASRDARLTRRSGSLGCDRERR